MAEILEMEARLKDFVSANIDKIEKKFTEFEKVSSGAMSTIGKSVDAANKKIDDFEKISRKGFEESAKSSNNFLSTMKGFVGAGLVITAFKKVVIDLPKAAYEAATAMETLTIQFKVLLGSTAAAKERMAELYDFAAKTPFELQEVANASRILQVMTKGALATGDGLRLIGDAAAGVGTDFSSLATWVGRAYDWLQANRPVGEAMKRMQELGVVSGEVRGEIEKLQAAGRGKEAWGVLEKQLKTFSGGMDELSRSTKGLSSTLKDEFNASMIQLMNSGVLDQINLGLQNMISTVQAANDSGVFKVAGAAISFMLGGARLMTGQMNLQKEAISQIIRQAEATDDLSGIQAAQLTLLAKKAEIEHNLETFVDRGSQKKYTKDLKDTNEALSLLVNTEIRMNKEIVKTKTPKGTSGKTSPGTSAFDFSGKNGDKDPLPPEVLIGLAEMPDYTKAMEEIDALNSELANKQAARDLKAAEIAQQKYDAEIAAVENSQITADTLAGSQDLITDNEIKNSEERIKQHQIETAAKLSSASQFFGGFAQLLAVAGEKSHGAAVAAKALAIGEAVINTAVSATKAYEVGMSAGFPVGLVFGPLAAAGAIAAGVAQVITIKNQSLATGSRSAAGGRTMVGEHGPEMIDLPGGTRVYSGMETRQIMNNTVNNTTNQGGTRVQISVNDAVTGDRLLRMLRSGELDSFISKFNQRSAQN